MKNIKTIEIHIESEKILSKINSTPTLKRMTRTVLKVGANIENVNHAQYADICRMYPLLGVKIIDITIN